MLGMLNSLKCSRFFVVFVIIMSLEIKGDTLREKHMYTSLNVRTVLFRSMDMGKKCWSREEIALLFTRRMMQELLPKRKEAAAPFLFKHFIECLLTVKKLAISKRAHALLITALSDTLGGYLQAYALPMAYEAFYEGTLCYKIVKNLNELHTALKKELNTDGSGWTKPVKVKRNSYIPPLSLSEIPIKQDHCQSLFKKNGIPEHQTKNDILLPFLDDENSPTAIAIPIKDTNLCGLKSYSCPNILIRYYSKSVWCLMQTYGPSSLSNNSESKVQSYFYCFHEWLTSHIIPRLDDNNFYPAFGSVLRIISHLENSINNSISIFNITNNTNCLTQRHCHKKICYINECKNNDNYIVKNNKKLRNAQWLSCQFSCLKYQINNFFESIVNIVLHPIVVTVVILYLIIRYLHYSNFFSYTYFGSPFFTQQCCYRRSCGYKCCTPECCPQKRCCPPNVCCTKECCRVTKCGKVKRKCYCKRCRKHNCNIL